MIAEGLLAFAGLLTIGLYVFLRWQLRKISQSCRAIEAGIAEFGELLDVSYQRRIESLEEMQRIVRDLEVEVRLGSDVVYEQVNGGPSNNQMLRLRYP